MTPRYLPWLLLAALAGSGNAQGQALPVDDSASQVLQAGPLKMRWEQVAPGPGQSSAIRGEVVVLVRLDVSPWRGRSGRIYQRLATVPSGPVSVQWAANGPLLPGRLRDGERTLVYAGPVAADRIEDTLRLEIQADGNRVLRPQDLVFTFEIELESP